MPRQVESIGKYRVTGEIGRGGMGAVYTAVHPTLGTTVIIKKLTLRGNAGVRERFRREAQIMMNLRHDAIVDVYDHFREGAYYYIVQEYVDGVSLDVLLKERGALPEDVALLIVRVLSRALAYAHDQNVIHRDIKPANILVAASGEVKLVDFGIAASRFGDDDDEALTHAGMTLGTPSYMAPEQLQDSRSADKRADIYSLGVVLYEMVTGERPFPASFSPEANTRIQQPRHAGPRKTNRGLSFFTARLIRRMLKTRKERRLSDLGAVVKSIDRYLGLPLTEDRRVLIHRFLENDHENVLPRYHRSAVPVFVTILLLLITVGTYEGTNRGYHRELFNPGTYGTVEVRLQLPLGERIITGMLHGADPSSENPITVPLRFRPLPEEHTEHYRVYRSVRETIPAGLYDLQLSAGTYLGRKTFVLYPLREHTGAGLVIPGQRDNSRVVNVAFSSLPELPVSLEYTVTDQRTGRAIEDDLVVSVLRDGSWRPATFFVMRSFRSGNSYTVRFEHPRYRTEEIDLAIAPHQSQVQLHVTLSAVE